jgi:MFS-type transporter involved in bile tolerance (Atg22 family)
MLLNVTGILFASQLSLLLMLGPYADYGSWRPYIMIIGQTILYICQFSLCGISKPSQWESAQALFVLGSLAANVVNAFYAATFPSLVRDLPKLIESEDRVKAGLTSPEEHNKLDSYERSKVC